MTKKEKKLLEINGLDRQIEKYRSNILELEEEYKFIKISYDEIVEKSYTPTKNYDFSALSVYGEDMQRKAEEYRKKIVEATEVGLRDTLKLLSEIQMVKQKIQNSIKECEVKKDKLLNELSALS